MTRGRTVGLEAFRKVIGSKPVDMQKIQVRPDKNFPLPVAARLVQAVVGVEGMKIFPSLFEGNHPSISKVLIDKCEATIFQHQLQPKTFAEPELDMHHNASLVSNLVRNILSNQSQSISDSFLHQEQVTSSVILSWCHSLKAFMYYIILYLLYINNRRDGKRPKHG